MGRQPARQRPGADRRHARPSATGSSRSSRRPARAHGIVVPMATVNLFYDPVVPRRRLHGQRPAGARLRGAEDAARHGPRRRARREDLRAVGRARRAPRPTRAGGRTRRSSGCATRSTTSASTRSTRSTATASRWRRSRTSRAATSTWRRPAPISASSRRSTIPSWSASTPRSRTSTMAGLNFLHAVAQAWEAGKLFHIDLNDQVPGRYDQDFRFGAANIKAAFFLVKFLEDVGYDGPRHFDAHAYRTEDYDGVRDFARGCMRTYLILKERAARWNADEEIQALVQRDVGRQAAVLRSTRQAAATRCSPSTFDRAAIAVEGPGLREARPADDGSAARRQVAAIGAPARSRLAAHHPGRDQQPGRAVRHPKATWTGTQFSANPMSTAPGCSGLPSRRREPAQDDRRSRRKAADRRERRGQR